MSNVDMDSSPTHEQDKVNHQLMDEEISSDEDVQTPGSGKRNEREEDDGSRSKKKTRSDVWNHYSRLPTNYNRCKCRYCKKEFSCPTKSGTSNLRKHKSGCRAYMAWKAANKSRDQSQINVDEEGNVSLSKVSEEVFKEATNEMIVLGELPLSFVESLAWKNFCKKAQMDPPVCRKTCTKEIAAMYMARKAEMKKVLGQNKQRLSLTTDIWTAPYTAVSYMVITAHFIDSSWKLRKMIIGFKNVDDHKGSTIARVLIDCLAEWDIKRVFCITVDNATANTSALKKFKEEFMKHGEDALVLKGEFLHVRCATHILNLIVKEGLTEVDDSLTAIRNGVQYVRSSTNRLKSFEFRVDSGKMTRGSLPLDVKTRWNSTYLMLDQAIKFRAAFEKMEAEDKPYNDYFLELENGKKRIGPATRTDWEEAERLVHFLVIFYNSTLMLSATKGITSHKIYNEIVTITRNVSKISSAPGPDETLRVNALTMMGKIRKYWNPFTEESESESSKSKSCKMNKLLIVATVFDPRKKMNFANLCFEKLYGKESIEYTLLSDSIMEIMKRLYEEYTLGYSTSGGGSGGSQSQGGSSSQTQTQDSGAGANG
ncbi:zinc finger BED domain-containing protein RICESLEEPER 2-like [Brassica rapa]|uniref:zinc finger BED domain-containing protein RICESLEEPER 2-like n=1 Tax=Brassica campestris TaxID=3711 RepID=UPI00142D531E|nr:zinc finger BED domain-containing protein RICESLEEPER 2-like [Brassica rapa]